LWVEWCVGCSGNASGHCRIEIGLLPTATTAATIEAVDLLKFASALARAIFVRVAVALVARLSKLHINLNGKENSFRCLYTQYKKDYIPVCRQSQGSQTQGKAAHSYLRTRQTQTLCFCLFRDPT
jgi:hypothetical protein